MAHQPIYVKLGKGCSNKCVFCNQRIVPESNNFGSYIEPNQKSLLIHSQILQELMNKLSEQETCTSAVILLMGGELFYQSNSSLYPGFDFLIDTLVKIQNTQINTNILLFSNLLYEDLSLLKYVLSKIKPLYPYVTFKTSFDLFGRFADNSGVDLFMKNFKIVCDLLEYAPIIKSVITRETLNQQLDESNYIGKNFKELIKFNNKVIDLCLVKTGGADKGITKQLDVKHNLQTLTQNEMCTGEYICNSIGKYTDEEYKRIFFNITSNPHLDIQQQNTVFLPNIFIINEKCVIQKH